MKDKKKTKGEASANQAVTTAAVEPKANEQDPLTEKA